MASRGLTPDFAAALLAKELKPILFVQAQFLSGYAYFCSAPFAVQWNGQTWFGAGMLGKISPATETSDVQAQTITLALSGIPNDLVSKALAECRPSQSVSLWFGSLDGNGTVIADPAEVFDGLMDVPTHQQGAVSSPAATISLTVETYLADMQKPSLIRYTDEDQQTLFPGDLFCQYVPLIQNSNIVWGQGSAIPTGRTNNQLPGPITPGRPLSA